MEDGYSDCADQEPDDLHLDKRNVLWCLFLVGIILVRQNTNTPESILDPELPPPVSLDECRGIWEAYN